MSEQRKHQRVRCDSRCDLVNRDGSAYPASLSDISAGGALVKVDSKAPLNTGDLIALKLNEDAVFHPVKRISRIVRIDSKNNYGLRFLVNGVIFKDKQQDKTVTKCDVE